MQWRILRGGCLFFNKRSVGRDSSLNATTLHRRDVYTSGPDEEIAPWDTSWSEHDAPRKQNTQLPYSSNISLKISPRPAYRGVIIDKRGQLEVTSRVQAERECRTALILSAASTSLTEADFRRLLPEAERSEGRSIEAVIPGRYARTLERLPYWILLFKSPILAASYQSRLKWYHQNAVDNLPMSPLQAALIAGRGLTPPPGYVDPESGEDVWKRLREYSLLQPAQSFSVTALLPRFPPSIIRAIKRHKRWSMTSEVRTWTVRIWVDGEHLTEDRFSKFLQEDGKARNRTWNVVPQSSTGIPTDDRSCQAPQAMAKGNTAWHGTKKVRNLWVRFYSECEAVRFWRTWHRRPFPAMADASMPAHHVQLLHVELTW